MLACLGNFEVLRRINQGFLMQFCKVCIVFGGFYSKSKHDEGKLIFSIKLLRYFESFQIFSDFKAKSIEIF